MCVWGGGWGWGMGVGEGRKRKPLDSGLAEINKINYLKRQNNAIK